MKTQPAYSAGWHAAEVEAAGQVKGETGGETIAGAKAVVV